MQASSLPDAALETATGYLARAGLRVLDTNWSCDAGHLDVVAADRDTCVAVQVRACSQGWSGRPLASVGHTRIRELRRLALMWLSAHGVRYERVRVDVVGVLCEGSGGYTVRHIRGAG